jgi:hypothetical protein
MGLSTSEKLALIREYKSQGGKGHYLGVIKDYEQYSQGGTIETINPFVKYDKGGTVNNNGDTVYINDPRKIRVTSGKPINPNVDLVKGNYPKENIDNIIDSSKRYGIDPNTLLAMSMQESGLGTSKKATIGEVGMSDKEIKVPSKLIDFNQMGDIVAPAYEHDYSNASPGDQMLARILDRTDTNNSDWVRQPVHSEEYNKQLPVDRFTRAFATKMKDADRLGITNETNRLQMYNGDWLKGNAYGVNVPKGGISLKTNPLYGKDVIDKRENVIKKNDYIQQYINKKGQGGYLKKNKTIMI